MYPKDKVILVMGIHHDLKHDKSKHGIQRQTVYRDARLPETQLDRFIWKTVPGGC